tara:strand:+ start:495 stop:1514 length:1020 start_codon:yes stop_codon:yes gene_type:complete
MRHETQEKFLVDRGYTEAKGTEAKGTGPCFVYVKKMPLAQVAENSDVETQIRPHGMNQDWINEMSASITDTSLNSDFPAVTLWRRPTGGLQVVDGLHRIGAMRKALSTHCDAYVIHESVSEDAINVLRRACNSFHGQRRSNAEGLKHAEYMVQNQHMTSKDAAFYVNLPYKSVLAHMKMTTTRRQLVEAGLDGADEFPGTTLMAFARLGNSRVRAAVAELARDARLVFAETKDVVTDIKEHLNSGSEADALREVALYRENYAERIAMSAKGSVQGPGANSPTKDIRVYFKRINSMIGGIKESQWTESSLKDVIKTLRSLAAKANAEADRLENMRRDQYK